MSQNTILAIREQNNEQHRQSRAVAHAERAHQRYQRHLRRARQVDLDNFVEDLVQIRHSCGEFQKRCSHCGAYMWIGERISNSSISHPQFGEACCLSGSIRIPLIPEPPQLLRQLLTEQTPRGRNFRLHICKYNSAMAMATMGASEQVIPGAGIQSYRVHGTVSRLIGPFHPNEGNAPRAYQSYFYDPELSTQHQMHAMPRNAACDVSAYLIRQLNEMLRQSNPYLQSFLAVHEMVDQGLINPQEVQMAIHADKHPSEAHRGLYNGPNPNSELAIIMPGLGEEPTSRMVVLQHRNPNQENLGLRVLNETHRSYDPLQYVLLAPHGTDGWHLEIPSVRPGRYRQAVSALEFYRFRIQKRDEFNPLLYGGRLFQQYLTDMWAKIESSRIDWHSRNQDKLRTDLYRGLVDAIASGDGDKAGRRVILPSSFTGGPRHMMGLYQDAMAIVRKFGKPHLFVTFTCNPMWPEIKKALEQGQMAVDRGDIVSRLFSLKKDALMDDIRTGAFGPLAAHCYTIEFQKRGLPHAHMLFILADEEDARVEIIDKLISAEIPDRNTQKELYGTVTRCMIHGPCKPDDTCMRDGKCTKGFPKEFYAETVIGEDCYPHYRRRMPGIDGGRTATLRDRSYGAEPGATVEVSNQWVVPYNPHLSLRYDAHINVEYCSSIKAVKYLYKYVFKGHDMATITLGHDRQERVQFDINGAIQGDDRLAETNEPNEYLNSRYIGSIEAAWRLLGLKMHDRYPAVVRLAVHVPGG